MALAGLCFACGHCQRPATTSDAGPAPAAGALAPRPLSPSPYEPVPPRVAEAMALRPTNPCQALRQLRRVYDEAADAGELRTAAIALHRSGDLIRDCSWKGDDDGGLDVLSIDAEPTYQRAYALHLLRGDRRLAGLAANDLGLDLRGSPEDVKWFAEAVRLRRDAGTAAELMLSLNNLGGALMLADRPAEAVPALLESVAVAADAGALDGERKAHTNLAASYLLMVQEGQGGRDQLRAAYQQLVAARAMLKQLGLDEDVCAGLIVDQLEPCHHLLEAGPPDPSP